MLVGDFNHFPLPHAHRSISFTTKCCERKFGWSTSGCAADFKNRQVDVYKLNKILICKQKSKNAMLWVT
jgi:hypothetical protein